MGKIVDKAVEFLYNKNNFYVSIIFLFGLVLRLISARNLGVSADDVNHAIRPIGIFGSGKMVIWDQSTALWYYIQGVFYKILGNSILVARLAEVIFGSLLIVLIFLFAKRVFKSDKVALIASFLVALSPILIKNSMPEMDIAASFFLILSAYFLFGYFESRKNKDFVWSAIFIGVGVMIKLYALFFAVSFIIFIIYNEMKVKKDAKNIIKKVLLFGIILGILTLPTLTHNYLLYKDQGFMDLIFTNTLKMGVEKAEGLYSWGAGWMAHTDYKGFIFGNQRNFDPTPVPGFVLVLGFLLRGDPILFILGFIGLIFAFKTRRDYFWFFVLTFIPAFIYLGAQIPLAKHFIWGLVLAAPCAGIVVDKIHDKIKKVRLRHILIVIVIFNLLWLAMPKDVSHAHFYGKSSFGQAADYNIPEEALVVVDSRIYRGSIHYGFAGDNYIEAAQFVDFVNQANEQGDQVAKRNIDVYYVECVIDDCGWGTVAGQPEFNRSMEELTELFSNISSFREDFAGPNPEKYYLPLIGEKRTDYRIYKTSLALSPAILNAVKSTHSWYLYPVGYDRSISKIFDDYEVFGILDISLSKIAWMIFYIDLFLAFFAMIYIVHIFLKN